MLTTCNKSRVCSARRRGFPFAVLTFILYSSCTFAQTIHKIAEANLTITLSTDWQLATQQGGDFAQYIFKRNPIVNDRGLNIVPAVMIFVEDARRYNQDIVLYTTNKGRPFEGRNLLVDRMLIHSSEDYPLSFKNSLIKLCSYTDADMDHVLYMIYLITTDNKGVQIYMDMTRDVANPYLDEFWTAMKSITVSER